MNRILLHPSYFGPISQWAALFQADELVFENEDNYQKQTYRNRMYIYGANGRLLLNIPVKHSGNKSQHQKFKEVRIENDFQWQKQHWKSLQAAYRTSPFFEFYEDEFQPLYHKNFEFLMDFNYTCMELVLECLQIERKFEKTETFATNPVGMNDARFLIKAKSKFDFYFDSYPQVFENKFGHIPNLGIVDLIFNEGPNAFHYLGKQKIDLG